MALGVLNNLSAIYAENNLNNTNSSLQTVLRQLSSGSKINSGADDAAGLSLVNGLQANSTALIQSETNATEGVGLLDVADGALSQVTSLLNRAISLATEASNGTLNSTQEGAANQEYQSILAEVNNIGSTTTYNQEQVFGGNTVAIYSGDSSMAGSSLDDLNIRTLSSSSLGDTGGVMSYNSGQDNVFINLSNGGHNAALTDSLNADGATTIDVDYMTKGAAGAATTATAEISVGSGSSYANTAQGLISAINNAGLGLTASFATASEAGGAAAATASAANNGGGSETDTGILISATGIGSGSNGAGVVGALSLPAGDTLGGTLSVVSSDGSSHNIALGTANSTDTLANLEATINAAGYGVTATLNEAGTQLTFTTADPKVTVAASSLTENSPSSPVATTIQGSGLGSLSVASVADTLKGTLNITEGADGKNTASPLLLGTVGTTDTLANLANTITSGGYGITAALNLAGTTLVFTKTLSDLGTAAISGSNLTDVATPLIGTMPGTLSVNSSGDLLAGTLNLTSGLTGVLHALPLGTTGTTDTLAHLMATVSAGYGITAAMNAAQTQLTFTQTAGDTFTAGVSGTSITDSEATSVTGSGALGSLKVNSASDTLSGTLTGMESNGTPYTITLGTPGTTDTLQNLEHTIDVTDVLYGITATPNQAGTSLSFTATTGDAGTPTLGNAGSITDTTLPVQTSISLTATPTSSAQSLTTLGSLSIAGTDTLSGSLTIGSKTLNIGSADDTAALLTAAINMGSYGVTASYSPTTDIMTFTSPNSSIGINTANLDATVLNGSSAVPVGSLTGTPSTASSYYSFGISGTITDTSTALTVGTTTTYGGTANVGITADSNGAGGTATMSYSDAAGQSLSGTDLLNQADAQSALNDLNVAITDVAAQDGYIGAQINTLNSISQVMSTQQENVVSAQNAIQATDYASATSNMSKYEILSQTGIAALAQANTVEQEVTKLLQ